MTFKVLEIGDAEWIKRVAALPAEVRDIHLDQRMLAPYVAAFGWRAGLAVTGAGSLDDHQYVIQPILITKDGQLRHAYNFGGPVAHHLPVDTREHFHELDNWAELHGATSQYCTLNPLLSRHQLALLAGRGLLPKRYDTKYIKDVVYVDLNNIKLRGTTRRAATKAKNAGVEVKQYDYSYLPKFFEMYEATMDRKQAKDHWYLPMEWFQAFCRFMRPKLLLAHHKNQLQAGCLLLCGAPTYDVAYYHFSGSYNEYPNLGIGQLMVLSATEVARAENCKTLHLGGGVGNSNDDGLFIFKSGFSPLRAPVYTFEATYAQKAKKEAA